MAGTPPAEHFEPDQSDRVCGDPSESLAAPFDLSIGDGIRPVHNWRMTILVDFGEMLVASSLAILLLAISPFGMSYDAALLVAGVVTWTLAEYVVHRFVLHGLVTTQHGLHWC